MTGWPVAVSSVDRWDTSAVLDYIAQALDIGDPACLAYALAAAGAGRGIAVLAVVAPTPKENAPGGAFVGLPGLFDLGGLGEGVDIGRLPEFGL